MKSRYCPQHRITISAPTGIVWQQLINFNDWDRWNPLYPYSEGEIALGQSLKFGVALPGMREHRGEAKVIALESEKLIRYQIKGPAGLLTGTRFIELASVEGNATEVTNGEIMSGLLAPLIYRLLGKRIVQGLAGMNEALKAEVGG